MQESTRAYLATALWSSLDENGEPLDSQYNVWNVSEHTVKQSVIDIQGFLELCNHRDIRWWEDIHDLNRLLHYFWLTRNGHGAGFWDESWSIWGNKLTEIAHMFPEVDLYVGDDGEIYHI